ncbi:MAG: hypothetical protein R6V56_08120 [Lentisphaeria bacterium]
MIHFENKPTSYHLALLILGTLILFLFLGSRVLSSDEATVALAAQQAVYSQSSVTEIIKMLELDTYPLPARLIELGSLLSGGFNEWSVRLPGALALFLTGVLAFVVALRKFGLHAAAIAFGVVCISLPGVQAARGGAGSPIAAGLIVAAWFGWFFFGWERKRWIFAWWSSLLLVLIATLYFGWLAFLFFYLPLFLLRRPLRPWPYLASISHTLPLALALTVFAFWSFGIQAGALPLVHLDAAFRLWESPDSYGWRLLTFPVHCGLLFLPWTFFIWPAYCAAFHRLEKERTFIHFLRSLILPILLMAWLIPVFKPGHLLLLLVPGAILCGVHYEILIRRHKNRLQQMARTVAVLVVAPALIACLVLIMHVLGVVVIAGLSFVWAVVGLCLATAGAVLLIAFFYKQSELPIWLQTISPLVLLGIFLATGWLLPYSALANREKTAGRALAANVPPRAMVYLISEKEIPEIWFYLQRTFEKVENAEKLPRGKQVIYVLGGSRPPIQETRNWEAVSGGWATSSCSLLRFEQDEVEGVWGTITSDCISPPDEPDKVLRMYRGTRKELSPNIENPAE